MTSSPGKEWCRNHTANDRRPWRRLWVPAGWLVLGLLAALAIVGYTQPELLLDYVNLRYCG